MGKRKAFVRTDISSFTVDHAQQLVRPATSRASAVVPPRVTAVGVREGIGAYNWSFDFAPFYGVGVDQITLSCQQQIERFLDGQDGEKSSQTVEYYCQQGLKAFLQYLVLVASLGKRELALTDINRDLIDGFLDFIKDIGATSTQKNCYSAMKAPLKALCHRGLVQEILSGDGATFPRNPFPNLGKKIAGERPLPKAQRDAFARAVKTAVMPIFSDDVEPTSELLAYALLVIALHTGRNTTPLLEMTPECLRPHPKESAEFLVLFKRRGHSTSKTVIRADRDDDIGIEWLPTLRPSVARLVRRVIELSERLRQDTPAHLRDRIWLYRMRVPGRGVGRVGAISALTAGTLAVAIQLLIKRYNLVDSDGRPLRINVSRLRKTFVNRIYEILDGDVASTAVAAGDTVRVTAVNYLRPGEDAEKNWRFMGAALVEELITDTLGATERTPLGRCSDNKTGDFAPKRDGATCMSFLNCVRCTNYVVTADDLHRLFSFYWRILKEQPRMDPRRWRRQLSHVVRLIDREIVDVGISKGIFRREAVHRERERARVDPHPFWRIDTILADLAEGSV